MGFPFLFRALQRLEARLSSSLASPLSKSSEYSCTHEISLGTKNLDALAQSGQRSFASADFSYTAISEEDASSSKPKVQQKVTTTAPWPWIDPSRPFVLPAFKPKLRPKPINALEALARVKENAFKRSNFQYPDQALSGRPRSIKSFDESIELIARLAVDLKKPSHLIRGNALLPHGTGKTVRIAVFAKGAAADEAMRAGADVLGDEELIQNIADNQEAAVNFDRLVATPDFMKSLAKVGRVLGPLGLMPNPKMGTLTVNVGAAVQELRAGRTEFRIARDAQIKAVIGKASFPLEHLTANLAAFMGGIVDARPSDLPGSGIEGYVTSMHLKSSMTEALPVDPESGYLEKEGIQEAPQVPPNTADTKEPDSLQQ